MLQFVLVHRGWQGGWCWDGVAASLREGGHVVLTPTPRGSEGGGVGGAGVDLTAIRESLVEAIRDAGLRALVLVAHSGGGPAIQYAADRLADITRRVASSMRGCCVTATRFRT